MTAPGMNAFSSGLLHPWMTPTHVIILLALGLWLGQHVPLRLGLACKVFAPAAALRSHRPSDFGSRLLIAVCALRR